MLNIHTYTAEESTLLRYLLRLNSTKMRATAWQSKNLPRGQRWICFNMCNLNAMLYAVVFIFIVGCLRSSHPSIWNTHIPVFWKILVLPPL